MSPEAMLRLRNAWETVNSRWNQWVMGYSRIQQFDLLNSLGIRSPDWFDLGLVLAAVVGAAGAAGALWSWLDRRRRDPWQRLHGRICTALATLGVGALAHDPPRRLALRLRDQLGGPAETLARALDELDRLRYANNQALPGSDWWPAFRRAAAALAQARQLAGASQRAATLKPSP
jgi:hypothetical protein